MSFRKLKKFIQMWRLARRRETQYFSYSLQTLVFRVREPAAKEIRRLHWGLSNLAPEVVWCNLESSVGCYGIGKINYNGLLLHLLPSEIEA